MTPPSATPRTDALQQSIKDMNDPAWIDHVLILARQLERELADRATPKPAQDEPVAGQVGLLVKRLEEAMSDAVGMQGNGYAVKSAIVPTKLVIEVIAALRAALRAAPTSPGNASPAVPEVELPADVEELVNSLESFAKAYPEDIFPPLTDEETAAHPFIITRASAAMGRHVSKWMSQAAALIAAQAEELRQEGLIAEGYYHVLLNVAAAFGAKDGDNMEDVIYAGLAKLEAERAAKEQAEAARLAAERDAARYRWLRLEARIGQGLPFVAIDSFHGISAWQGDDLDERVDEAMDALSAAQGAPK